MAEETCENCDCMYRQAEKCTLSRALAVTSPHGAECLKDIMEIERERFTG